MSAVAPSARSQPELKRTLGSLQLFAISFAFISVAVGVFATYGGLLTTAGPRRSGRPWWRLASPKVGWLFGWLTFWYLATAVVAMDNALASQAFMPLAGMPADEDTARVITVVILVVQAVLVIASTRLLGMISSAAVAAEIGLVVVLVVALAAVVVFAGSGDVGNLTSRGITAGDGTYFAIGGGLMAGMLMGLTTLVGFDSAVAAGGIYC